MTSPYLLTFPVHGAADSGWLAVAEGAELPFAVRRVYWIFDVPTSRVRGRHTHRTLEQLLIAVHGELRVTVELPGTAPQSFTLTHPTQALYVPPGSWRAIEFSPGAVLLSLASHEYDEADYVRG